ncbi:MAG: phosphotransferase family protein [Gammaproteobacteria bacterium]|nr:phosphotransferase family protein [Gammaproteobacteria bacterium]
MSEIKGIAAPAVSDWLTANLDGLPAPYRFDLIAAGGSNLTYITTAANGVRFVLRRGPLRARLATAHDMQREYRIMQALAGTCVPVPAMFAYCADESVNGAEFYCMEMVDGLVLRDRASTMEMSRGDCLRATESLVDVQVAFHQVDLGSVGLGDLSRHAGYIERQLSRWKKQVDAGRCRDVPLLDELHEVLRRSVPPATKARPGLAHGDYRFDNTVLDSNYRVSAVLDWELCTIGDPLADFIWSLGYWAEPGEQLTWLQDPPTKNPQFPRREVVTSLYAARSGDSLDDIDWYTAFSWWKQACIVEGIYSRMQNGASGGMKLEHVDLVGQRVIAYLERARSLL